jgi:hypothetical protein
VLFFLMLYCTLSPHLILHICSLPPQCQFEMPFPQHVACTATGVVAGVVGCIWLWRTVFRTIFFDQIIVVNNNALSQAAQAASRVSQLVLARVKRKALGSAAGGLIRRQDRLVVQSVPLTSVYHADALCRHLAVSIYNVFESRYDLSQSHHQGQMAACLAGIAADQALMINQVGPLMSQEMHDICVRACQFRNRIVEHPEHAFSDVSTTVAPCSPGTIVYTFRYQGMDISCYQAQWLRELVSAVVYMTQAVNAYICRAYPSHLAMFETRPVLTVAEQTALANRIRAAIATAWTPIQQELNSIPAVACPPQFVVPAPRPMLPPIGRQHRLAWMASHSLSASLRPLLSRSVFAWGQHLWNLFTGVPVNSLIENINSVVLWSSISSYDACRGAAMADLNAIVMHVALCNEEAPLLQRAVRNAQAHANCLSFMRMVLLQVPIDQAPQTVAAVAAPLAVFRVELVGSLSNSLPSRVRQMLDCDSFYTTRNINALLDLAKQRQALHASML